MKHFLLESRNTLNLYILKWDSVRVRYANDLLQVRATTNFPSILCPYRVTNGSSELKQTEVHMRWWSVYPVIQAL